jgi:hypothetical protein
MPLCYKCNKSIKPVGLETKIAGESYHPTCIQCATCDKPLWGKPFKRTKTGSLVCEQPCNPRMRTFTRDDPPATAQPSTSATPARPPSANKAQPPEQKPLSAAIDQQLEYQKQMQFQNNSSHVSPYPPPESYRKPVQDQQFSSPPPQYPGPYGQSMQPNFNNNSFPQNQFPAPYGQPMQPNFNNGPIPQQQPFNQQQNKICKVCVEPVYNKRYITFENGEIICQECDNKFNMRPPRVNSGK